MIQFQSYTCVQVASAGVGDWIELQLMWRQRGSTIITPYAHAAANNNNNNNNKIHTTHTAYNDS